MLYPRAQDIALGMVGGGGTHDSVITLCSTFFVGDIQTILHLLRHHGHGPSLSRSSPSRQFLRHGQSVLSHAGEELALRVMGCSVHRVCVALHR